MLDTYVGSGSFVDFDRLTETLKKLGPRPSVIVGNLPLLPVPMGYPEVRQPVEAAEYLLTYSIYGGFLRLFIGGRVPTHRGSPTTGKCFLASDLGTLQTGFR